MHQSIKASQHTADLEDIPIKTHIVRPNKKQNFWFKTLGRGNPVPTSNSPFRWCTDGLKIQPMQQTIKKLLSQAPVSFQEDGYRLTLWMGLRNEESARRRSSIASHSLSDESLFGKHDDFEDIRNFYPLKFVTGDELWFKLLDYQTLPYGVKTEKLLEHYDDQVLECGIKTSNNQGSACGGNGNRQGCWACAMMNGQDKMLLRYINQKGCDEYQHLLDWKNALISMRNDIRYREAIPRRRYNTLMKESIIDGHLFDNDYETFQRADYPEYIPGGLTVEGRKLLLEYLLYVQQVTGFELISAEEVEWILEAWKDTDGIELHYSELNPKPFQYDGPLVFTKDKRVNKVETKTEYPVFYVTIDMKLEEQEFFKLIKRKQRKNTRSYYFFPEYQDFSNEQIVWNKATFVVCEKGVTSELEAYERIYEWLGWIDKENPYQKVEDFNLACRYLMLSALREGLTTQYQLRKGNLKIDEDPSLTHGQVRLGL